MRGEGQEPKSCAERYASPRRSRVHQKRGNDRLPVNFRAYADVKWGVLMQIGDMLANFMAVILLVAAVGSVFHFFGDPAPQSYANIALPARIDHVMTGVVHSVEKNCGTSRCLPQNVAVNMLAPRPLKSPEFGE